MPVKARTTRKKKTPTATADWAELVLSRQDWATVGNALARSSHHTVRQTVRHIAEQVAKHSGPDAIRIGASTDAWQKFLSATLQTLDQAHPALNIGGKLTVQLYHQIKR